MNNLPTEVERRRRLVTRALPLTIIAIIAFALGASAGAPGSPEKEAAERFSQAWAQQGLRRDVRGAERSLAPHRSATANSPPAYREAAEVATLRTLDVRLARRPARAKTASTVVPVPIEAGTVAFGTVSADLDLPYAEGGIAWDPSLVFPGLEPGEHLENRIDLAPRAPILARDGTPLAEGPAEAREHPLGSAAIDVTGEVGEADEEDVAALARQGFPAGTPVGISGLEQAFNARLAGQPGGSLLAVAEEGGSARILSQAKPQPGAPVKTTIDPDLQVAAVSGLAGRAGGVAVLDARNGDVRALAGQAFSAPQPPGSTFKTITTTAALEKGVVSLDDEFEIVDGANVGGRFISNANGEFCGGTFREAFAESCNADFAPLGPKIGNDEFVETAERFGFNSPPDPLRAADRRRSGTARIDDPDRDRRRSRPRRHRDRPGRSPGDAAADGDRRPDDRQRRRPRADLGRRQPEAAPRRRAGAGDVEEDRRRADRTDDRRRHRRAPATPRRSPRRRSPARPAPPSSARSPAPRAKKNPSRSRTPGSPPSPRPKKAKLAVGVLLIEAEAAGGEVAAPIAGEVLSAGL